MRKQPKITPPEHLTHQTLAIVEQRRTYDLITPLYGGGVNTTEPDAITIVRATEVRGQLRFWWRVMRGGQSAGERPLKEREDAIWGKAYEKNDTGIPQEQTIQISVDPDPSRRGKAIKPFEVQRRRPRSINGIPGYAAFPLQPDQKELQKAQPLIPDLWEGVRFTLTITYPTRWREEIEAALWAWETFGGLGARTRRGFGALTLLEVQEGAPEVPSVPAVLPTAQGVERWIRDGIEKHLKEGTFPSGIPHLSRNLQFVVLPAMDRPMQAWNALIRKLQDFRLQKEVHNRSAWPEADAIRKIARKSTKNMPATPQTFPRAAFGLPIIFHFTGDDAPDDHTLNEANMQGEDGAHKERFASPLILRPLLCRDNRAVGLALLLEGSRVDVKHLILEDGRKVPHSVEGSFQAREIPSLTDQMPMIRNETDVLQAFLKFCKGVK
ncbi:MAG: type III-B CRISPR module RAMP protein Cmr1 [Ktedonobacteraceae bacterium]|nr:type III-B CRISPR module RAMP protein Cmr1 [Ktedonobacteraceae bacterium]